MKNKSHALARALNFIGGLRESVWRVHVSVSVFVVLFGMHNAVVYHFIIYPSMLPKKTEEDGSETRANEAKQKRANEKDEGKELNLHEQTNNVVVVVCVYCVQEKANLFINLRRLQSLLESKLIIISQ